KSTLTRNYTGSRTADGRQRSHLIVVNVPSFSADDFLSLLRLGKNAGQIPHRPGRHEQGRLAPEDFRGAFLKLVDGRILYKNVVADFRLRHCAAHLCGWFRYGVAAAVDSSVGNSNSSVQNLIQAGAPECRAAT